MPRCRMELLFRERIHQVGQCFRGLVRHLEERAPRMVERGRADERLTMGFGQQPPPAALPTSMPMPFAAPPASTARLQHAAIATDLAGRPRRRRFFFFNQPKKMRACSQVDPPTRSPARCRCRCRCRARSLVAAHSAPNRSPRSTLD